VRILQWFSIVLISAQSQLLADAKGEPTASCCDSSRVYSSVRLVPEVDDYVGTELVLWRCSSLEVAAELRVYEGGHDPVRIQLEGTFLDGKFLLRGTLPGGDSAQIDAALRGRILSGAAQIGSSKVPLKLPSARRTWAERVQNR
jgi:hypothetical protein